MEEAVDLLEALVDEREPVVVPAEEDNCILQLTESVVSVVWEAVMVTWAEKEPTMASRIERILH